MKELPDGWELETLEAIATWSSGGTPKSGTSAYYGGTIPWAVIGDLNDATVVSTAAAITEAGLANSSAKVVEAGTVLVAMYGSIGKLGIAGMSMATNQAIACAVPSGAVDRRWLFWWLRSQRAELLGAGKGGTQANISQTVLKAWPIPIAPLAEQQRIVTAIEEAVSKIEAGEVGLRTVRQLLKRMREAVLAAAVTGRLVPQEPTDILTNRLPSTLGLEPHTGDLLGDLPAGWCWSTLGDVSSRAGYGSSVKCGYDAAGLGVLRIPNIQRGRIDLADLKRAPEGAIPDDLLLAPGDLLIVRTNGSRDLIGRSAPVMSETGCSFASYLIRFRLNSALVDGEYVSMLLSSPAWRRRLEDSAASSAGQYNLSLRTLEPMPVALPPLTEQRRIVAEVERQSSFIDACERAVKNAIARSDALRRSVMKGAFGGQLVGHDQSDEPASVMLERVRAERALSDVVGGGRRRTKAEAP